MSHSSLHSEDDVILNQTTHLQVTGSTSASTSEPDIHVAYIDWTPDPNRQAVPALNRTVLNGTTDVTVLSAPLNNQAREIVYFSCFNRYAADRTITVKTDDGTTETVLNRTASLSAGKALVFVKGAGWSIV